MKHDGQMFRNPLPYLKGCPGKERGQMKNGLDLEL